GTGAPSHPAVGRDDNSNDLLISYGRVSSGGDYDLYARMTDDSFAASTIVFTDVTANWSTRYSDVACVRGANRWIIVMQRDFTGNTGSWIRSHTHATGDTTLSTAYPALAGSSGNTLSVPEVGGTAAFTVGDHAFV